VKPSPDTRITPRVRLRRELGQGGMGSVWVARHEGLDSDVAVKFIAPKHVSKAGAVERFRREASTAARLTNPHVVKVFDHGISDEGHPFIVMELLKGESLSQRIARGGPLGAGPTSLLVTQVAKVLTEAHALGIVHRDLKPANLFLVDSGYELFVKVLDFGIAKQTRSDIPSELTETGAMVGTPHFMSPEMLMSTKAVDERADLWALAVVAYVCLTGRPPFDGETLAALSVAIHEGRFEPPSSLVPGITPAIDAWFKVALCRAPGARFPHAEAMAYELDAAVGELDAEARRSRPSAPLVRAGSTTPTPVSEDGDTELGLPTGAPPDDATTQDSPLGTLEEITDSPRTAARTEVGETAAAPQAVSVSEATLDGIAGPRGRGWRAAAVLLVSGSVVWAAWPQRPAEPPRGAPSSAPPTEGPRVINSDDSRDDFVAPTPLTLPTAEVSVPSPAPAPARRPSPAPATEPAPAAADSAPAPARPAYCEVTPFSVNAEGDIVPKPECFPVK